MSLATLFMGLALASPADRPEADRGADPGGFEFQAQAWWSDAAPLPPGAHGGPSLRHGWRGGPAFEDQMAREADKLRAVIEAQRAELRRIEAELSRQGIDPQSLSDHQGERVAFGDDLVVVRSGERVAEVVGMGSPVEIAGHVLGDATSFGGDIRVLDGGVVEGSAVSFGGRVVVSEGGVVLGDRIAFPAGAAWPGVDWPVAPWPDRPGMEIPDRPHHGPHPGAGFLEGALGRPMAMAQGIYDRLVLLLSFAGAGILVVGMAPNRVDRVARSVERAPIRSALLGLFGSGVIATASFLFGVTLIGIPVSFLLLAALGLAWLVGFVGVCQVVGDRLPFQQPIHGRWLAFLVGVLVVTFAGSLPWVGWMVVVTAGFVGIGAALTSRFGAATAV